MDLHPSVTLYPSDLTGQSADKDILSKFMKYTQTHMLITQYQMIEKETKGYKKKEYMWAAIDTATKYSGLTILAGAIIGGLGLIVLVPQFTALGIVLISSGLGSEVLTQAVIKKIPTKQKEKFIRKYTHAKTTLDKLNTSWQKATKDNILTDAEIYEFKVLLDDYEKGKLSAKKIKS